MLNPLSRTLNPLTPAQGSVTQSRRLFGSQLRERRELEHITPSVTQTRPFQTRLHLKAGFARQVLLPASRKAQSGAVTGAREGLAGPGLSRRRIETQFCKQPRDSQEQAAGSRSLAPEKARDCRRAFWLGSQLFEQGHVGSRHGWRGRRHRVGSLDLQPGGGWGELSGATGHGCRGEHGGRTRHRCPSKCQGLSAATHVR